MTAPSQDILRSACETLAERDGALAKAYADIGVPDWRARAPAYATLARTIAYQQISTAAAGTIWGRVETLVGEVSHDAVLAHEDEALRACGLSRPKVAHLKSIAQAVQDDRLNFDRLMQADLDAAREELVAVRGIGPWTAEIFCLYAKGALDAFPHNDIGLSESWRLLSGEDERHDPRAFAAIASAWSPYRGVACHLLWGWINAHRQK